MLFRAVWLEKAGWLARATVPVQPPRLSYGHPLLLEKEGSTLLKACYSGFNLSAYFVINL